MKPSESARESGKEYNLYYGYLAVATAEEASYSFSPFSPCYRAGDDSWFWGHCGFSDDAYKLMCGCFSLGSLSHCTLMCQH